MSRRLAERLTAQTTLGSLIRFPLRVIPRRTTVRTISGINRGYKWIVGSGVHGYWLGHYERDIQALLCSFVKPGMVAFDIGANAGFFSLAFAKLVGRQGRVYAFEPEAENVSWLLRHIELNELTNVQVVQAAVSERMTWAPFRRGENTATGALDITSRYLVPTASLDGLWQSGWLPVPDVVKIEVEGGRITCIARRSNHARVAANPYHCVASWE